MIYQKFKTGYSCIRQEQQIFGTLTKACTFILTGLYFTQESEQHPERHLTHPGEHASSHAGGTSFPVSIISKS
jgi:hypothetical protein